MRKLLLLLISFVFICSTQANERVDLSCTYYESNVPTLPFGWGEKEDKEKFSLTIFPNTSEFIFDYFEGEYKTKGNKILFANEIMSNYRMTYSLDRVTGVINETVYQTIEDWNDGKEYVWIEYRGKCKVVENLF